MHAFSILFRLAIPNLLKYVKTIFAKALKLKIAQFLPEIRWLKKPVFTEINGSFIYSHYHGQNHVRKGGQKKISRAALSFTAFNPSKENLVIRELRLLVKVNSREYVFKIFDNEKNCWIGHYNLAPRTAYLFSWTCIPEGTAFWQDHYPGVIPFSNNHPISFCLIYRDEKGHVHTVPITNVIRHRFNPALIAA